MITRKQIIERTNILARCISYDAAQEYRVIAEKRLDNERLSFWEGVTYGNYCNFFAIYDRILDHANHKQMLMHDCRPGCPAFSSYLITRTIRKSQCKTA